MSMSSVCHQYVISRQLNIPSTDVEAVTSLIGTSWHLLIEGGEAIM